MYNESLSFLPPTTWEHDNYNFSTLAKGVGFIVMDVVVNVASESFDELQISEKFENVRNSSMCKQVRINYI